MYDGEYPRLTETVRRTPALCGPKGRWWTPDEPQETPEHRRERERKEALTHSKEFYARQLVGQKLPRSPYRKP